MGDQQKIIAKQIQILIESEMPQWANEKTIQEYQSYFMRMLSGRFGSSTSTSRNNSIGGSSQQSEENKIKAQLIRQGKTSQQQLRLQELMTKLDKYPSVIQNKSGILMLLSKLSDSAEQNYNNSEALFKNNKEGIQQNQNMTMEIENNTTMNTLANNSQNNFNHSYRSILSQSNVQFQQTVKRIHNKGNPNIDLTENDLIRDLLFTFQAIDGHYINFNKNEEKFVLKSNVSVSDPVRELVNKLCIMGDLYYKIQVYLQAEPQGQIRQSLHQAIYDELNEYYRLIAIFEKELNTNLNNQSTVSNNGSSILLSQVNNQGQITSNENNQFNNQNNQVSNQFTLRKLQLWVIEPLERLRWLAVICDATRGMNGFQVISAVNAYQTQGSPPIQQLISRILQNIVQPFIKYVNSWVYNGELNDPLGEFFVIENFGENDIWNKRYSIVTQQIPNIIEQKNAVTIFNIGRSINFLQRACKSSEWKLNLAPCDLKIVDKKSFDVFKQWIEQAAFLTNNRIVNILVDKYQLKFHFQNIKKYILMGQGDFIQQLMENLSESLSKNANEIHRHNLVAQLDGIIKTNTQAYQESSQRLDIKLLEASPGDKGWDIFSLDYHVDSPIDTILSPQVMKNYLKIFNFLWRIRRVSHCLSQVWIDHMKSASLINKDRNNEPIQKLMKKFNILRHQMTHFINNLTCYIMVDAIETTWKQFLDDFDKTKDFTDIIQTHTNFVQAVLDKSLLTEKYINIYRLMNLLFNIIIKFRNTQLVVIVEIQEEYERMRDIKNSNNQKRILNQHRMDFDQEDDEYGSVSENQFESEDFQIPQTAKQFRQIQSEFQKQFSELLLLLKKEDKLRFLSFKLDFNEYYVSKQTVPLSAFGQDQLNKYSTSGNLKMNTNFSYNPSGSGFGSSNNLKQDLSPFNNSRMNQGFNSNLSSNRETQFFKQDNNTQLLPFQGQIQIGDNNTKDSFFSNGSNILKNNGFLNKNQQFVQNNSLFNQNNSSTTNNIINKNTLNINNEPKQFNAFLQSKLPNSKQDFFKSNISSIPQSMNQMGSNLDISNNKIANNSKMDEEHSYNKNNESQFSTNTIFKNNQNDEIYQRVSAQFGKPQENNFFKQSNVYKVTNRNNMYNQGEVEDQKDQDSDQNDNSDNRKEHDYEEEHDQNQFEDGYEDEQQNQLYDNDENNQDESFE